MLKLYSNMQKGVYVLFSLKLKLKSLFLQNKYYKL